MNRERFEYALVRRPWSKHELWHEQEERFLKARGDEGWLLTAVLEDSVAFKTYYFARIKEDS